LEYLEYFEYLKYLELECASDAIAKCKLPMAMASLKLIHNEILQGFPLPINNSRI